MPVLCEAKRNEHHGRGVRVKTQHILTVSEALYLYLSFLLYLDITLIYKRYLWCCRATFYFSYSNHYYLHVHTCTGVLE